MSYNTTVKIPRFFKSRHPKHSIHWKTISKELFPAKVSQKQAKLPNSGYNDINHRDLAWAMTQATPTKKAIPTKPQLKFGVSTTFSNAIKGVNVKNMISKLIHSFRSTKAGSNHKPNSHNSRIGEIEITQFARSFTPYTITPILIESTGIEDFHTANEYFSPPYSPLESQVSPLPIERLHIAPPILAMIPSTKELESSLSDIEWGESVCAD